MLHLCLPIRPRTNVSISYLTTLVSLSGSDGLDIPLLTEINSHINNAQKEYRKAVSRLLPPFSCMLVDTDSPLVQHTEEIFASNRHITRSNVQVLLCECGKYEELIGSRRYELRRLTSNNRCTYCDSRLSITNQDMLFIDVSYLEVDESNSNRDYIPKDYKEFSRRSNGRYHISKASSKIRTRFDGSEFGIRHQAHWASIIANLCSRHNDFNVTIHYVDRVHSLTYLICSIAKTLDPRLKFFFTSVPTVWFENDVTIIEARRSHVKLLGKAIQSKRKDLKVSLSSWR